MMRLYSFNWALTWAFNILFVVIYCSFKLIYSFIQLSLYEGFCLPGREDLDLDLLQGCHWVDLISILFLRAN